MKTNTLILAGFASFLILLGVGCDTGFSGEALQNQPPDTQLSVQDNSLVDNLEGGERLTSTVLVSWSGTDPDGFIAAFEVRFFDEDDSGANANWARTTSKDTLILLPIGRGERIANVAFEVRAIDNEGLMDPDPARTIFPIQNSPPEIRLSNFDLPPDTTFSVFSFAWRADDPDGLDNLSRIEVSLNDSVNFVSLPVDAEFATFSAEVNRNDPSQTTAEARVFIGRAFQSTQIYVPGVLLDEDNTFYVRSVDQTDTTSTLQRHSWHVKKPKSSVLLVNDYRKASNTTVIPFHKELLQEYLPAGMEVDTWDLSLPFVTGNTGNAPRSNALPPAAAPTLRRTLELYDYIYWVSTAATNGIAGNNLPLVASVMDLFFEQGGKLMVHLPVSLPQDPEANLENAAIAVLPLTDLIVFPDSLRRLSLPQQAPVAPIEAIPGLGTSLPTLSTQGFIIGPLPYLAESENVVRLYSAQFRYLTRGGSQGDWTGASTVASISADQRVGLFALPLINEQSGAPLLVGDGGDPGAARQAVHMMLESLGFPKQ